MAAEWCKREHRIASASRGEAARNEEGGGSFRACGNSFVRKTRGDGIYDDGKREAVDRLVGRSDEREETREAQVRRRASGRIEKEVSEELADGEERQNKRERKRGGREESGRERKRKREKERTRGVEGDGGGDEAR